MLSEFGGRSLIRGDDEIWNFGLTPKTPEIENLIQSKPLISSMGNIAGAWDGRSTINHWDAVLKNYNGDWVKAEELIHNQPRGTCGGRAGALAADLLQHVLIALGKRATFKRTSHAAVYYVARKKYGMIGGNWQNENNDGVASGSVPEALAEMGFSNREEIGDNLWYGAGSDDLACKLAAGLEVEKAKTILEVGKDNLLTAWVPIKSAQELADGIAAGGIGIGSDSQGFEMTRNRLGFCNPRGTWHHYHVRASVGVFDGVRGFGYCQSWGKNNPSGPRLKGHPGNCFGVEWSVQDHVIRNGDWAVLFSFPLWEERSTPVDIPWRF